MPYETAELIELVFLRPRMFSDAETLRELLLFVQGICTGRNPPHGSDCPPGFDEFVLSRFRYEAVASWPRVLLVEYGDLPFLKACEAIAKLISEWRSVDMREEIDRLVREGNRPDRLFPIRSEKDYGFYAGRLADGRQVLVTCGIPKEVRVFEFSREGDYLGFQRRTPVLVRPPEEACLSVNDRELHEFLRDEFGFTPDLIRIKRFAEPAEGVSIDPIPAYLEDFAADPEGVPEAERHHRLAELARWVGEGDFVLNTWNDYWLDHNGEVSSS